MVGKSALGHPDGIDSVATLVRAIERRDTLSRREREALGAAISVERTVPARGTILAAHHPTEASTLLLEGMIARQIHLPTGKREIMAVHVPGDFVDLHSFLLKSLDHDVVALTDTRVATVPHDRLRRITENEPHLSRLLWFLTTVDAAVHRQWFAVRGRAAAGRIAHLLCELQMRLEIVGLADDHGFALPLTQADLGDMTGLTAIHVNRTLKRLRESSLAEVQGGRVTIPDLAKLRALAEFDPTYLYAQHRSS